VASSRLSGMLTKRVIPRVKIVDGLVVMGYEGFQVC
jgi:hypothetical protein